MGITLPRFSRVEIRHENADDLRNAASELRALAKELDRVSASVSEHDLMRMAAHHAIRETSVKLRGKKNDV